MKSLFLLVSGFLISLTSLSQRSVYEGPALWLKLDGATEKFRYATHDTLKRPDGEYYWRQAIETSEKGKHELTSIKANFKNGIADGDFELLHYTITFGIEDFDIHEVKSHTLGNRILMKGKYEKGKPIAIWQFDFDAFDGSGDKRSLIINQSRNTITIKSDSTNITGRINDEGIFDGIWTYQVLGNPLLQFQYQKGLLVSIKKDNQNFYAQQLNSLTASLQKSDSLIFAPESNPWLWDAGLPESDSLIMIQLPFSSALSSASVPYKLGKHYLGLHPLINIPQLHGTSRAYLKLSWENIVLLENNLNKLTRVDSILKAKLQTPVFQLRRSSNAKVDSMLKITEALSRDVNNNQQRIIKFLAPETRLVAPQYLSEIRNDNFKTQDDYVYYLDRNIAGLNMQADEHIYQLMDLVEKLRIQGALEELETEWITLKNLVDQQVESDSLGDFEMQIYKNFIVNDFANRKSEYPEISASEARREFLLEAVSYYHFFYEFYKNKMYRSVTSVSSEFYTAYTKYLYNPYMGVNNVEVVVKKKFLQHMLQYFWPYLLDKLQYAENGQAFQERYQLTLTYKDALLLFADDYKHDAKRLERRGRNEKDMRKFESLLEEYLESLQE